MESILREYMKSGTLVFINGYDRGKIIETNQFSTKVEITKDKKKEIVYFRTNKIDTISTGLIGAQVKLNGEPAKKVIPEDEPSGDYQGDEDDSEL